MTADSVASSNIALDLCSVHNPKRVGSVRIVWRYLTPSSRRTLLVVMALRTVQSSAAGFMLGSVLLLVDGVRTGKLTSGTTMLITLLGFFGILAMWCAALMANKRAWTAGLSVVSDLRLQILRKLRDLPLGFHYSHRGGDTLTVITSDTVPLETLVAISIPLVVDAVALPFGVLITLSFFDPILAMVVASSMIVSAPVWVLSMRRHTQLATKRAAVMANMTASVTEFVQGIAVLRAFNAVPRALAQLARDIDAARRQNVRLTVKLVPPLMAYSVVVDLGIPLMLAVGGYRWVRGTVDAGILVLFLVIVLRVYTSLQGVAGEGETLRLAQASLQRISRVLDAPGQLFPSAPTSSSGHHDVKFTDVRLRYEGQDTPALNAVSFTAQENTTTAIVGASGAGKTTVLRAVARYWDTEDGTVCIGGVDVRMLSSSELFDMVAIVDQHPWLFSGTVRENVTLARPTASDDEVWAALESARAADFVSELGGLEGVVGEGGSTLSGGQRQRMVIARALLKDAPILLLDEYTSALDATTEREVTAGLRALARGRTVLVVAHRLTTIRHADQILVMDHGSIVQEGTHDTLISSPGPYQDLWRRRQESRSWRLSSSSVPDA